MRPRSITGPLILILIGGLFLMNNVYPGFFSWELMGRYWPFILIAAGVIGLIEVLFHASRGAAVPPRPLAGPWIFWIVLLCFIFWISAIAGNVRRGVYLRGWDNGRISILGSDYDYDVSTSASTDGVARVVLDNLEGNITLKGEESGGVAVTGRKTVRAMSRNVADRTNQQSPVRIDRQGDILFIRAQDSGSPASAEVTTDLDITVPKSVNIEARGRAGDLEIDDLDGSVDLSAGRGDVRLNRIGKDVKIESRRSGLVRATDLHGSFDLEGRGGDVQLENIAGQVTLNGEYSGTLEFRALASPLHFQSSRTDFSAEAVPGSVTITLGDVKMSNLTGPVHLQSNTRDIEADDISGAVDFTVDRGDIEVMETKGPLPKIDVRSRNGDITLGLPDGAGFQLSASTARGEVENEFGGPLEVQHNGRASSLRGRTGAGPQLTLTTDRGTIVVKKS